MNFEELKETIVDTIGCEDDEVTAEASLIDDLGADSLAIVELQMELEDRTGIHIEDEDLTKLKTVNDVLTYVNEHAAA